MSNIEENELNDDCIIYSTSCDCGDDNHRVQLWLEYENDLFMSSIFLRTGIYTSDVENYNHPEWLPKCLYWLLDVKNFFSRLKFYISIIKKLVSKGCVELDGQFYFHDEKHLREFADACYAGAEKVHQNRSTICILKNKVKMLEEQIKNK